MLKMLVHVLMMVVGEEEEKARAAAGCDCHNRHEEVEVEEVMEVMEEVVAPVCVCVCVGYIGKLRVCVLIWGWLMLMLLAERGFVAFFVLFFFCVRCLLFCETFLTVSRLSAKSRHINTRLTHFLSALDRAPTLKEATQAETARTPCRLCL